MPELSAWAGVFASAKSLAGTPACRPGSPGGVLGGSPSTTAGAPRGSAGDAVRSADSNAGSPATGRVGRRRGIARTRESRQGDLSRFSASAAGQGAVELVAGADVKLGEDLVQVVFDGARAHEQLGGDLGVGQAVAGQPGDLGLPGGELGGGAGGAVADPL